MNALFQANAEVPDGARHAGGGGAGPATACRAGRYQQAARLYQQYGHCHTRGGSVVTTHICILSHYFTTYLGDHVAFIWY